MTDQDPVIGYLGFSLQQLEAQKAGWLQSRYYGDDDSEAVKDFLSFEIVNEICPFEVGGDHRKEKAEHNKTLKTLSEMLKLTELMKKGFSKLSNGEMRRVLLAREILKTPDVLVIDDPMGGLDAKMRSSFRAVFDWLEKRGVKLVLKNVLAEEEPGKATSFRTEKATAAERSPKKKIVEIDSINVKFARRKLFDDFSWTIREGERWVLRGENGAGKTTLMALISGDSPLAYSLNITVFGQKREVGKELSRIRGKIGMVSPEMQLHSGESIDALLDKALKAKTRLLLLDEPCMNLDAKKSAAVLKRISEFLTANPSVAAIMIAHHSAHIPKCFTKVLELA